MTKRMLIDATHAEETRVVVLDGSRLEDFDVETSTKRQLKGNIYLAKVVRVEPSLQAAFVEYGGNRHGFLAFGEIHPDYYQIPVADRQRLIEMQAEDARLEEEEEDRAAEAANAGEPNGELAGPTAEGRVDEVSDTAEPVAIIEAAAAAEATDDGRADDQHADNEQPTTTRTATSRGRNRWRSRAKPSPVPRLLRWRKSTNQRLSRPSQQRSTPNLSLKQSRLQHVPWTRDRSTTTPMRAQLIQPKRMTTRARLARSRLKPPRTPAPRRASTPARPNRSPSSRRRKPWAAMATMGTMHGNAASRPASCATTRSRR